MSNFLPSVRPATGHLAACYVAYLLAAGFGRWMMVVPDISITIWPPNGVVLAALLSNERRTWVWWIAVAAVGELTANALWFGNPILPALAYVSANAVEVVLAAVALGWFTSPRRVQLSSLRQTLALLAICVLAAPAVGATLGSAIDAIVGKSAFATTWPLWWLGDATGILIATPLVMSVIAAVRARRLPTVIQAAEAILVALVLVALAGWLYSGDLPYAFVLFVPILWSALRFEMLGAAFSSLMIALIVGFYAQFSAAPATGESAAYQHGMLQLFVLVAAATGLIVAAIIRQQRSALSDLAAVNAELEQRVAERTRDIALAEQRFRTTFENAAVGMSILDPDGKLLRVNESFATMLGSDVAGLEGLAIESLTHPDDLESHRIAWQRLCGGEAMQHAFEQRYVTRDGEIIWGLTSLSLARAQEGPIAYVIAAIQDVTERRRSDEVRQMLMQELNHRSKNMLATVQAIARQTAQNTPDTFLETFRQRLQALSGNQDLLVKSGWQRVDLEALVRGQLGHFSGILDRRVSLSGPPVAVSARAAQTIGMALHELATNAAKHGSLSTDAGRVTLHWGVTGDAFEMEWAEHDGPAVQAPARKGFGSTVTGSMVELTLEADVAAEFAPAGFVWRMRCPASALREEQSA